MSRHADRFVAQVNTAEHHRCSAAGLGLRRLWRHVPMALALAATAAPILFCSRDYNPFADLSNARAHVIGMDFGTTDQADSVFIFSTYTLRAVVALPEEVDSFSVVIPSNRLGDTITLRNGVPQPFEARSHAVSFSLSDTGLIPITIVTHRSNGETITGMLTVRAVSPLHQDTVLGYFDETLTLATDSVADRDVWYWWAFDDYALVKSAYPSIRTAIRSLPESRGTGRLWVTDNRQDHASPWVPFVFTLGDTTPPTISLATPLPGPVSGDTLWAGDSSLWFRTQIVDPGNGWISSATVNGQPFDLTENNVHSKLLSDVHSRAADSAMVLAVTATDRFNNTSSRTFYLLYSDTVTSGGNLTLALFIPGSNPSTSPSQDQLILGEIRDYAADSVDVDILVTVNDSAYPLQPLSGSQGTLWQTRAALTRTTNTVAISLTAAAGARLDTTLSITYSPSAADTTPPVIADMSSGGRNIDGVYMPLRQLPLRVIAYDQGTGIDTLYVNGAPLAPESLTDYLWLTTIPLNHTSANVVVVRAVDKQGNVGHGSAVVFSNHPAVLVDGLSPAAPLRARQEYRDTLIATDEDYDRVAFALNSAPDGLVLNAGVIVWTPADSQIGDNPVSVQLYDGYQTVASLRTLHVLAAENAPCSLSFGSSTGEVSGNEVRLYDTSGAAIIAVTIHDGDPASSDRHTIEIKRDGIVTRTLSDTVRSFTLTVDPSLSSPGASDTIVVTVTDKEGTQDTLVLVVRVLSSAVPPVLGNTLLHFAMDSVSLTGDVVDFPLLVRLDSSSFDFTLTTQGGGLRFEKNDGTVLPYELETWDTAGQRADIWVLVDTVHAGISAQNIVMVWDSLGTTQSTPSAVFDTAKGFSGVWHLAEEAAGKGNVDLFRDATAHEFHGLDNITATGREGAIGNGHEFAPSSGDWIDLGRNRPYVSGTSAVTVEGWFKASSYRSQAMLITHSGYSSSMESTTARVFLETPSNVVTCGRSFDGEAQFVVTSSNVPTLDTWHHITGVVDYAQDSIRVYVDGILRGAVEPGFRDSITANTPSNHSAIGSDDDGGDFYFDGYIDEVRSQRNVRSASWIRLSYETQKPGNTFIRFEDVQ